MKNIFERAYLGKPYKTRDGRKAYFRHYQHGDICPYMCLVDGEEHWYRLNGKNYVWKEDDYDNPIDIISEWKEEINEEELDELVMNKYPCNCSPDERYCECCINPDLKEAFKAGYRKAFESLTSK